MYVSLRRNSTAGRPTSNGAAKPADMLSITADCHSIAAADAALLFAVQHSPKQDARHKVFSTRVVRIKKMAAKVGVPMDMFSAPEGLAYARVVAGFPIAMGGLGSAWLRGYTGRRAGFAEAWVADWAIVPEGAPPSATIRLQALLIDRRAGNCTRRGCYRDGTWSRGPASLRSVASCGRFT